MLQQIPLQTLNDFFLPCMQRSSSGIYFCRLTVYNPEVAVFLPKFFQEACTSGAYIHEKISNPTEQQLSHYEEILGTDFEMERAFVSSKMQKWFASLSDAQQTALSDAVFTVLTQMQHTGKTGNMLKNAFIKFMCWLYYDFERVLQRLGADLPPKILYFGEISSYELKVLQILAAAGCDVLLTEPNGDRHYQTIDPSGQITQLIPLQGTPFPADFSLQSKPVSLEHPTRKTHHVQFSSAAVNPSDSAPSPAVATETASLLGELPRLVRPNCWAMTDNPIMDIQKTGSIRNTDARYYDTVFIRLRGAEQVDTYASSLYKCRTKIESSGRGFCLLEGEIPLPTPTEVQRIHRQNETNAETMLQHLLQTISYPPLPILEKYLRHGFYAIMQEYMHLPLQKLMNKAVILLCWIARYLPQLFDGHTIDSLPVLLHLGGLKTDNEADFIRIVSRTPVDILLLCPDLQENCILLDPLLYEKTEPNSLSLHHFPTSVEGMQFGTAAFHAENDLTETLYQDSGLYRNQQFKKAMPICLQTTYEEIAILWNTEAKYRPNFEVLEDRVVLPVLFSKVCGVPENQLSAYWRGISHLQNPYTFVLRQLPFLTPNYPNTMKNIAANFLVGGKLQIQRIKSHPAYPYAMIREEMQDYMLDKLQKLIDRRLIAGTFTNGMEYTITAVALNLPKAIVRLIQNFDFTQMNPKLVVIYTTENLCTVDDSILLAYLHLLGFDIALFVPTGYQCVERYYTQPLMTEHQIGGYRYDLPVPDLKTIQKNTQKSEEPQSFAQRFFRRGR